MAVKAQSDIERAARKSPFVSLTLLFRQLLSVLTRESLYREHPIRVASFQPQRSGEGAVGGPSKGKQVQTLMGSSNSLGFSASRKSRCRGRYSLATACSLGWQGRSEKLV